MDEQRDIVSFLVGVSISRFSHNIRSVDRRVPGPQDGRSSSEVMYEHCFRNLRAKTKAKLKESRTPL
ncbi:hypothetical protein Tco_0563162, partial [Tanacetum coccineum]